MPTAAHEKVDWYDLPLYYDMVFAEDTQREGDFLEAVCELYGGSGGRRALEPACGSGRLLVEMAHRGWEAAGFDANPNMLRFAAEKRAAQRLEFDLADGRMERFESSGGFDLAFCLVSTFKYLLSESHARSSLRCVAKALQPGGLFVLGLHLTDYACTSCTRERWVASHGAMRVTSNLQIWPADRRQRLEKVRSRLRVEEGLQTKRYETLWNFRTYDAKELRSLLAAVPQLEHLATYDFSHELHRERPLDDDQLDTVLVLRKR